MEQGFQEMKVKRPLDGLACPLTRQRGSDAMGGPILT